MDEPFIVNVADATALSHSRRATVIDLEPADAPWPEVGINIQILEPKGKARGWTVQVGSFRSRSDAAGAVASLTWTVGAVSCRCWRRG